MAVPADTSPSGRATTGTRQSSEPHQEPLNLNDLSYRNNKDFHTDLENELMGASREYGEEIVRSSGWTCTHCCI